MKTVVIGLDSASWNVLMPWIKEGFLPTFDKLINEGTHGYLRSSNPPITFPAWKCYSTGKNPGKLGVHSFVGFDKENKDMIFHTGFDFKSKEIWDYLSENDLNTCVINMPGTYPPKKVGVMISGGPILGEDYIFPAELKYDLETVEYKADPDIYPGAENSEREHNHLKKIMESRFQAATIIKNKYDLDFYHITIFYIDKIQHSYFNNESILKDYWIFLDKIIGDFLSEFNEDINLMLMSDHGATEIKNTLYLNEYLLKNGYLSINSKNEQKTHIIFRNSIKHIVQKIQNYPFIFSGLKKMVPYKIKNKIGKSLKDKRKNELLSMIDWEKSNFIAIGMGFGLIYKLNDKCDIIKLKRELEGIIDPITGEQVAEVHLSNEVYTGNLGNAPDIIITPKSNTMVTEVIRENPEIWGNTPNDWKGMHEKEGLFLAHGPQIKVGEKIEGAKIYDLAPTILHMFGVPIPDDMDGKVLNEIFLDGTRFAGKDIKDSNRIKKASIKQSIKELKSIGKI